MKISELIERLQTIAYVHPNLEVIREFGPDLNTKEIALVIDEEKQTLFIGENHTDEEYEAQS